MPAHKLGRLWRFKIDEVDEWIRGGKQRRRRAASEDTNARR
jgi:predicted DNA-binding transcriptional regulator AlpA